MVIAVDFDGTIVEDAYPLIGKPIPFAFNVLHKLVNEEHHQLVLWTVRTGKELDEALQYCRDNGLEFYAANKLYPDEDEQNFFSRKIVADMFIDDRNVGGLPDWGLIYDMIKKGKNWESIFELQNELPPKKKGFFQKMFS